VVEGEVVQHQLVCRAAWASVHHLHHRWLRVLRTVHLQIDNITSSCFSIVSRIAASVVSSAAATMQQVEETASVASAGD